MNDYITKRAGMLGFKAVFALAPKQYNDWRSAAFAHGVGEHVIWDVPNAYAGARAVLLLVYPYRPYNEDTRLSAYYAASNRAYHAAKSLADSIAEKGFFAENAFLPARAVALDAGIGVQGRNGLLRIDPFGSRIVLQTVVTNAVAGGDISCERSALCHDDCVLCRMVCPMGAIANGHLMSERCMRYRMDGAWRDDDIKHVQKRFLGCEECMYACPFNAGEYDEPAEQEKAAFALDRLIAGDTSGARAVVGKNMAKRDKLTVEAIVFAAKDGGCEELIKAHECDAEPAVRDAVQWAKALKAPLAET